jgi:hypothetical protein
MRMLECLMSTKMTLARALARDPSVSVEEKRRRLARITADVRKDYDQRIADIRADITALGTTAAGRAWQTLVGLLAPRPSLRHEANLLSVAKLRAQLAETHTAKFAALAELKFLKAFA